MPEKGLVGSVLTKKNYASPLQRHYLDKPEISKNDAPKYMTALYIFIIVLSGIGEWKVLNETFGGLFKAVTLLVIGIAVLRFVIKADYLRLKVLIKPTILFSVFLGSILIWSFAIWAYNLTATGSIIRGISKVFYQAITVMVVLSTIYIFSADSNDVFFYSICFTNLAIMLAEMPTWGIGPALESLINCIVSLGNAEGYAERLEIHDLTFVFGQFFVYYAMFSKDPSAPNDKKKRIRNVVLACFFMIVGMKRTSFLAAAIVITYCWLVRKTKKPIVWIVVMGIFWIAFDVFYIWIIRSGIMSKLFALFNVNTMGRDWIWSMTNDYYDFSLFFIGRGFEAVDAIVKDWFNQGLLDQAYPFHNDVLKVFVELGGPGFVLWTSLTYIIYPIFWYKYGDTDTALLYMAITSFMSVTYLTDNTAFYFWSCLATRLIPFAHAIRKKEVKERWTPPSEKLMASLVQEKLTEAGL